MRLDYREDKSPVPFWFVRWPCHLCSVKEEKDFQGAEVELMLFIMQGKWLCLKCIQIPLPL